MPNDMITAEYVEAGTSALLTADQSAAFCAMATSTWYKHLSAGKIPRPVKIGSLARWRRDELSEWIAAGCPNRTAWDSIRGENKLGKS